MVQIPNLQIDKRDREYKLYPPFQRNEVVYDYLFKGSKHRELDETVLGLDSSRSNGWQAMGILHHVGLKKDFQGLFADTDLDDALKSLKDEGTEYRQIVDMIVDYAKFGNSKYAGYPEKGEMLLDGPDVRMGYDMVVSCKTRRGQEGFRHAVLEEYGSTCCMTGVTNPKLLIASHIVPWSAATPEQKTDPSNGLCLNGLHDRAFDQGLITLDTDYTVEFSSVLKKTMPPHAYSRYFKECEGETISLPSCNRPKKEYIEYHRKNVFVGSGIGGTAGC